MLVGTALRAMASLAGLESARSRSLLARARTPWPFPDVAPDSTPDADTTSTSTIGSVVIEIGRAHV